MTKRICDRLAGGESLRSICRAGSMPHVATVCRWIVSDEKFCEQYMRAREAAGYAHADRITDVVELLQAGTLDHQTARAMMDGLKWAAERMAPKKHSPRLQQELSGPEGGAIPTKVEIVYVDPPGQGK